MSMPSAQFESTAARTAFPCFDGRPSFKIPFATTLVVPKDDQALSNTHEIERNVDGSSVRVRFAPTLPLPSYLNAFAVGPARRRCRRPTSRPTRSASARSRSRAITMKGHGKEGRLRAGAHQRLRRAPRAVHRDRVSVRQARHHRGRRQGRRDGERRRDHLRRFSAAVRREDGAALPKTNLRDRHGPRSSPTNGSATS